MRTVLINTDILMRTVHLNCPPHHSIVKRELLTLRKQLFNFLSIRMGYDHGDSFPFDFEPNGFPFGSKSKVKLSP